MVYSTQYFKRNKNAYNVEMIDETKQISKCEMKEGAQEMTLK